MHGLLWDFWELGCSSDFTCSSKTWWYTNLIIDARLLKPHGFLKIRPINHSCKCWVCTVLFFSNKLCRVATQKKFSLHSSISHYISSSEKKGSEFLWSTRPHFTCYCLLHILVSGQCSFTLVPWVCLLINDVRCPCLKFGKLTVSKFHPEVFLYNFWNKKSRPAHMFTMYFYFKHQHNKHNDMTRLLPQ